MKTIYEIKEERRKLVKWLDSCDDEMRQVFIQQIKIIDWVLNEDGNLIKMGNYKKCSSCGEIKKEELFRKVTIYEKVKMRFRGDSNYVGHTKLELCADCLTKIGYSLTN